MFTHGTAAAAIGAERANATMLTNGVTTAAWYTLRTQTPMDAFIATTADFASNFALLMQTK